MVYQSILIRASVSSAYGSRSDVQEVLMLNLVVRKRSFEMCRPLTVQAGVPDLHKEPEADQGRIVRKPVISSNTMENIPTHDVRVVPCMRAPLCGPGTVHMHTCDAGPT